MLIGAGPLMVLFGAKLLGVLRLERLEREARPLLRRTSPSGGFGGGLAFGAAFGLGWTPCVGPVLGAALTDSASTGADVFTSTAQLGAHALGLALPLVAAAFVAAAFAAERVPAWARRLRSATPALQKLTGALMVATGGLLATDRLDALVPGAEQGASTTALPPCDAEQGGACTAPAASPADAAPAELLRGTPRLIEFMSSHCPACVRMAPVVDRLERACAVPPDTIVRVSLDDPRSRGLADRYGVRLLPTFMVVDTEGNEVERFVGEQPEVKLAMAIENVRGGACVGL